MIGSDLLVIRRAKDKNELYQLSGWSLMELFRAIRKPKTAEGKVIAEAKYSRKILEEAKLWKCSGVVSDNEVDKIKKADSIFAHRFASDAIHVIDLADPKTAALIKRQPLPPRRNLIIEPGDKCEHLDKKGKRCRKDATVIAANTADSIRVGLYCEEHAMRYVAPQDYDFARTTCPNCACRFRT